MDERQLLAYGLSLIAQCKRATGDIWQAHIGAAAIGGYFLAHEYGLDDETAEAIRSQADRMRAKHPTVKAASSSPDCVPERAEAMIADALEQTLDRLHWVGHNVIYSAVSLKALRELGQWGNEDDIAGIVELIRAFKGTIPGRSWIGVTASEVKRMSIEESDGMPRIEGADQLSEFVLVELAAFQTIYRAESHHDLIGHLLTFSHGLNMLHDLGFRELFEKGVPSLLVLAKALRGSRIVERAEAVKLVSPVDRLPLVRSPRSAHLPHEREYWQQDFAGHDWDFGHVFKFPFSFYDHLRRVTDESLRARAMEQFRYIVQSNLVKA
ncbi:hypothetical protein [Paenibacillus soyae]|uniref:Uncharacterized protein n=1 Tax=Paenibacillus soyae TaxID=2969249 RepID=A0A9X2SBB1_9BACL|nr:hypothetical protein [Paenibacillus soyae]